MEIDHKLHCNSVCIVIPTHNRKILLQSLLLQIGLQKQLLDDLQITTVVVVDGSTDGTLEMLAQDFPDAHVVQGDGNWWYTKSMNEGFKYALKNLKTDFMLTMNDDTEVEPDFLSKMLDGFQKVPKLSIIGAMSITHENPKRVVTSGSYLSNKLFGKVKHYIPMFTKLSMLKVTDQLKESHILPGRGMLIHKDILQDVGLFDEKLRQYHSDSDFCLRAKRKGYGVYTYWGAKIFVHHKETGKGTSFKKESFLNFLSNFFSDTSRIYLPGIARYKWRYSPKLLWPLNMLIFIGVSFRNHFFKHKI